MVLPKLAPGGIFVTQSGPAGILSAKEVFTLIHSTLRSVFPRVLPYTQHIPSFCDQWGYNLAFKDGAQVRTHVLKGWRVCWKGEQLEATGSSRGEGGVMP